MRSQTGSPPEPCWPPSHDRARPRTGASGPLRPQGEANTAASILRGGRGFFVGRPCQLETPRRYCRHAAAGLDSTLVAHHSQSAPVLETTPDTPTGSMARHALAAVCADNWKAKSCRTVTALQRLLLPVRVPAARASVRRKAARGRRTGGSGQGSSAGAWDTA